MHAGLSFSRGSYRPGSRNVKPDALSRRFFKDSFPVESAPLLPPSCLVAPFFWDIEERVKAASVDQPRPSTCPPDRLFVPALLRSEVLQWSHSSKLTCYLDVHRTKEFLQRRFWWPTVEEDVREFVKACLTCNQHKPSPQAPAGHLHPLPIPHCPLSHIPLDFVTGLPPTAGNTTILTIVDRFSKMGHFIPLQ